MSEEFDPTKTVEMLPLDALVEIKVSGFFYGRLIDLLNSYCEKRNIDVATLTAELSTREPRDVNEYHFLTIISLIEAVQVGAREQKKLGETTYEKLMSEQGKRHES